MRGFLLYRRMLVDVTVLCALFGAHPRAQIAAPRRAFRNKKGHQPLPCPELMPFAGIASEETWGILKRKNAGRCGVQITKRPVNRRTFVFPTDLPPDYVPVGARVEFKLAAKVLGDK